MNKKCSICEKSFTEWGNNPAPFNGESCCDECNLKYVIPVRLYLGFNNKAGTAMHFKADGSLDLIKPDAKYFTLPELQGAVGGLIELYPNRMFGELIVCNEEGLIRELPVNKIFAKLSGIELAGDILLCPPDIFEEPEPEEEDDDE